MIKDIISWKDFEKLDIRVGTIIKVEEFPKAFNPSYILHADFGVLGVLKTAAQITKNYTPKDLINQQIIAVVNFPKKQIANKKSDFLTLGAVNNQIENIILIQPQSKVKNGSKVCWFIFNKI